MTGWSAGRPFAAKMRAHGVRVAGVGAQSVDGLGRKRDQLARAQVRRGARDGVRGGVRPGADGRAAAVAANC